MAREIPLGVAGVSLLCLVVVSAFLKEPAGPIQDRLSLAAVRQAQEIYGLTGVEGGLVVHLGCGDGTLTSALYRNEKYLVHGITRKKKNVTTARATIQECKRYGTVSVDVLTGDSLPYADNLVSLLVVEDAEGISEKEMMRVVVPGGVACRKQDTGWTKWAKPVPDTLDEWSHYLHGPDNNAVAQDREVGPPRQLQWTAKPLYCRSHEIDPSISAMVSSGGRLFYILDEGPPGVKDPRLPPKWVLTARDAFNGVLLWKRPINRWGWREWKKEELTRTPWTDLSRHRVKNPIVLPRRLVAAGDKVFVTLDYKAPVTVLNASDGKIVRTLQGTRGTDEIVYDDGVLLLCRRDEPASGHERVEEGTKAESVMAVLPKTGNILWEAKEEKVLPLSLASKSGRVFFHNYQTLICIALKTGEELWRTELSAQAGLKRAVRSGFAEFIPKWGVAQTLVATDKAVFFMGPHDMTALSTESGEALWKGPGSFGCEGNAPSLYIAGGLLWYGGYPGTLRDKKGHTLVTLSGHDLLTGEVKKQVTIKDVLTAGHHIRCHRGKATDRYLLWSKRGVEFLDLEGENHKRNDWLRGPCRLGVMPAGGLLHVPPHQCFCYAGVMLNGFVAMSSREEARDGKPGERLIKGPAYGSKTTHPAAQDTDWPTYRHDTERSGSTPSSAPAKMKVLWEEDLGGVLTQPIVANGKLFICREDSHEVRCLDAAKGQPIWNFTAGGRIDSPPTFFRGFVLFGSKDGWVYCLRAKDGELVWRFRGGPMERRIVAFGQIESAWPIHGSVLVKDSVAYFAAGRSSFLDGGIYLYGLDPETGRVLHTAHLEGPYDQQQYPFDMEGAKTEVLVSGGDAIYLRQVKFDAKLQEQQTARMSRLGDRMTGLHLFSTSSLLRRTWWDRTFWMYSARWPGYYLANQAPKCGQLLVFNDSTTFGVKYFETRNTQSHMHLYGLGHIVFADRNTTEPMLTGENDREPVKWLPSVSKAVARGGRAYSNRAINRDKGVGFTRQQAPLFTKRVKIRARAMVLAGNRLFLAGPPDVVDPDDPLAAFEGRKGAEVMALSASNGEVLPSRLQLDTPPVFDGMVCAGGRLYIATLGGKLLCLK